jgi:hypothetical protein
VADPAQTSEPAYLWDRTVAWRQGSFLPTEIALKLGLISDSEDRSVVIVISHDCDCVNDEHEPFLEVIVGEVIQNISDVSGNLTHAKNTRVLHLSFENLAKKQFVELKILNKKNLRKEDLVGADPDPNRHLSQAEKATLANWLAARYQRAAFPEELARRFRKVEKTLKKVGERNPTALLGIYIDYEPQIEIANEDEPYEIGVFVVYSGLVEGAEKTANEAAKQIKEGFEKTYKVLETTVGLQWQLIDLRSCEIASDTQFTLQDLMTSSLYRLEHISLRQTPQAPVPIEGGYAD